MRELITEPTFVVGMVATGAYLLRALVGYMARRNPEQDAWDKAYKVTGRVVAWVEQSFRKDYGSKLNRENAETLKSIAITEIENQLDKRTKDFITKNQESSNPLRKVLGTIVEDKVIDLKDKVVKRLR